MNDEGHELRVLPVAGLPEIETGANLGEMISALAELHDGDVVVIAQKAVSKAEDRVIHLSSAIPGAEARRLAAVLGKEPALVQLILEESKEVLRAERNVLITETRHGFVCANAGIDTSNLSEEGTVCLLPEDPDASARKLRAEVTAAVAEEPGLPPRVAVVISDSFGRAWRLGQAEVAIGCAGLTPIDDWRGRRDANGNELEATMIAIADEAAAAADLVRSKDSRVPAVVIRGLDRFVTSGDGPGATSLRRPRHEDLFR
jgi:coenzyme F420-0:L-glutamate ligase/coenzyme F420-1:gamma-L-glutamate ligase